LGVLLVAASLLLAPPSQAQEEIPPPPVETPTYSTALETYLERPGVLLVKRHHRLVPVSLRGGGEMRLDAIVAHEPGMEHQRVMGIRIEADAPQLTDEERVTFLDVHEIDALGRGIDFMKSAMAERGGGQEADLTEISISTRDQLQVGVRFAVDGARPFLRTPSTTFWLGRASFDTLRENLNLGRQYLFSE
jgi:hypothetical protein